MRPRCRYCGQPVANAGDACGVCAGSRIAQADEDAARQGKLLVGDVLAAEEARERVFGEAQAVLKTVAYDGRTLDWDAINALVDRIFDIASQTAEPKPPVVSEEARARAREAAGYQMQKLGLRPTGEWCECLVTAVIDALGYTPAPTGPGCDNCGSRTCGGQECLKYDTLALPPVVELAPDELRNLASVIETYEHLHTQLTEIAGIDHVPPHLDVWIDEGQSVRVLRGKDCWVLRIGGTDE